MTVQQSYTKKYAKKCMPLNLKTWLILFIVTETPKCLKPIWVGDGYCDDVTNTFECNFDGGDCCGSDVNTEFCTFCLCKNE